MKLNKAFKTTVRLVCNKCDRHQPGYILQLVEDRGPDADLTETIATVACMWCKKMGGLRIAPMGTGHTEELTSSYSVCMTWGFKDNKWYLLDLIRARFSYPDLKRAALRLIGRWRPDIVLIEKASSGFSLVPELRIQHGLRAEVRAVTPKIDKIDRLEAATAELETGKFLLPANAP